MLLNTVQSPGSRNKNALASIPPLLSILFQYLVYNIRYSWRCFVVSVLGLFSKCSSTVIKVVFLGIPQNSREWGGGGVPFRWPPRKLWHVFLKI